MVTNFGPKHMLRILTKCDRLYVFINSDSCYENPALAGAPLINDVWFFMTFCIGNLCQVFSIPLK